MLWLTMWGCGSATLQVLPSEPTTADVIQVSATNRDGEFIAVTDVDWYRDGLLTVEARELSPNWTSRGQVWDAEVTLEDGTVLMSETVEIVNALPEIAISIIPEQPTAGYPVTCDVQIVDADEDVVAQTVYWESAEGVRIDNASLSPSESTLGNWTCHVEADDTLDVARESVTVDIIELPDLPNESAYLSDNSFERGDGWAFDSCARIQERQGMVPQDGDWMVFGQQDECLLTQRVDLLSTGYSSQHVDASDCACT